MVTYADEEIHLLYTVYYIQEASLSSRQGENHPAERWRKKGWRKKGWRKKGWRKKGWRKRKKEKIKKYIDPLNLCSYLYVLSIASPLMDSDSKLLLC